MSAQTKQHVEVSAGTMAYVDTGETNPADGLSGRTVVFVHGNPASSAEYTPAIERLRTDHRCIAVDHLGFGDSDRPTEWDYLPAHHAENLAVLLDRLDLANVTLVVGDWGGPIGLSWALDHPDRVDRLVITNTWLWPVDRSLYYQGFSRAMGGIVGRYMIRNHNLFADRIVKSAWGTRTPLTAERHRQFTDAHPIKDERKAMWVFPGQIIGSTRWLQDLWSRREVLRSMEIDLVWGMKDIAFRADILKRWNGEFPDATVHRLDDVGHFVALEATNALVDVIARDN